MLCERNGTHEFRCGFARDVTMLSVSKRLKARVVHRKVLKLLCCVDLAPERDR